MTATDNYTRTLQQFTLQKIKIVKEAGREKLLGGGSFTSVLELDYNGLKCAGKKVHDWLLKDPSSKSKDMVRRFVEECDFLSQIRHPNIVHFLGFYFQPQVEVPAPILVMEFLPIKLTSCIEQYGILPKEISYTILHDVALGLCYLHSQIPPIIHRNLNSHNVLLTPDMTAKISDLGKAKILMNVQTSSGMTNRPGNDSFMPPEAMVDKPNYDTCIDEFSYGVIMIHMFSGKWPAPQIGQIHVEGDKLIAISEAERREVFLRAIGNDHPLMDLILKCIHNDPQTRAHASEIKERLAEMVMQFPASFANRLEMLRYIEADKKNSESMTEKINLLKSDVEHLQSQVATLTVQNYDLNEKYVLEMNAQDADETAPRTTKTKLGKVFFWTGGWEI